MRSGSFRRAADAWRAFRQPVDPLQRLTVAAAWRRLSPEMRVDHQTIGRQEEGCGATIGVMPRCDFGCTACYLGSSANATPALPVDDVKAQMRLLRGRLGRWGNLQLTDGEILLRPIDEVIELLRYARREVELIPMLMTHGDHFRRQPGLLERLMTQGGLVELSFHIDATQRGRDGYADARCEADLMPLRDEFADMIRVARRSTRLPLRVASTATVTDENLGEVPDVIRWFRANADAFRIISFQPAATVGRTRDGVGRTASVEGLWDRIADGLDVERELLDREQWWFGHAECSRLITGLVLQDGTEPERYVLVGMGGPAREFLDEMLTHFGGISFRNDTLPTIVARLLGIARRRPTLVFGAFRRFVTELLRQLDPQRPWRLARRLLTGSARLHPFTIGSHHFMSADELDTPLGRDRLDQCIFTVPIDGELVSMCEVNHRLRDRFYATMRDDEAVTLTVGST